MRERLPLVTDEFASGVKNRQLGGGWRSTGLKVMKTRKFSDRPTKVKCIDSVYFIVGFMLH